MEIRKYREATGMNKSELAKKMCVTLPTISRWESGKDFPSAVRLPDLATVLNCTIDELFGREPFGQSGA